MDILWHKYARNQSSISKASWADYSQSDNFFFFLPFFSYFGYLDYFVYFAYFGYLASAYDLLLFEILLLELVRGIIVSSTSSSTSFMNSY